MYKTGQEHDTVRPSLKNDQGSVPCALNTPTTLRDNAMRKDLEAFVARRSRRRSPGAFERLCLWRYESSTIPICGAIMLDLNIRTVLLLISIQPVITGNYIYV